jgi:mono/diheme cytochrome c family protein
MIKAIVFLIILTYLSGCLYPPSPFDMFGGQTAPPIQEVKEEFESNGEMIYYTGFNEKGERIQSDGGPHWLYMHGGACVSCHGPDGKGGGVPHMCTEVVPPITYHDLTEEEHGEREEHPPYTDEDIKKAITVGVDPSGNQLDPCMPRWKMSDKDLEDLIEYLKTL